MTSLNRYRKNLPTRKTPEIRVRFDKQFDVVAQLIADFRDLMGATKKVPPHPQKYPQHADPEKGSVYGGECNRTACREVPAMVYNRATFGYYCVPCARAINGRAIQNPLCVEVDNDLTHEEMNERYLA